jgi:acetylglutamate kinase
LDKLIIVKIGGNIIDDAAKLSAFTKDFASIEGRKILVHGGGKLASRLAEQLNLPQTLVDGRRITDEATLKIVTMVYAGFINKSIVAQLQSHGCQAMGLSGVDGNLIQAHKRSPGAVYYGFAGDIDRVNNGVLHNLLSQNLTPVVAPITHDKKGQLLNTNADTIAQEIAKALSADFEVHLIYSFEKSGVLLDPEDDNSVIEKINPAYYRQLKEEKIISSGMLPKLDNAFSALDHGVKKVVIGKAEELHQLIQGKKGTAIVT